MQSGSGSSGMVASPVAIHSSKEIFGLRLPGQFGIGFGQRLDRDAGGGEQIHGPGWHRDRRLPACQ